MTLPAVDESFVDLPHADLASTVMELARHPQSRPEDLRRLVRTGPSDLLLKRDCSGLIPLMIAARHATGAHVQALLDAGPAGRSTQALETDAHGETALMIAAHDGDLDGLRRLIPVSDPNARSLLGVTALMRAAQAPDPARAQALIPVSDLGRTDALGLTALMWAAREGRVETVQHLLDAGASSAPRALNGRTALIEAAWGGSADTVARLAHPARLLERDRDGRHALDVALEEHHLVAAVVLIGVMPMNAVREALDAAMAREPAVYPGLLGDLDLTQAPRWGGATGQDLRHARLRTAAQLRDPVAVRAALDAGGDPNQGDTHRRRQGASALTLACLGTDDRRRPDHDTPETLAVVRDLLDAGAAPNGTGTYLSPLMAAVQRRQWAVARVLLDAGASPDLYLGMPVPPPPLARQRANVLHQYLNQQAGRGASRPDPVARLAMVQALLDAGVDPNARYDHGVENSSRRNGLSALHLATELDDPALIHALLDAGARVDPLAEWVVPARRLTPIPGETDWVETGWTPLMNASARGKLEACQALIDRGADLHHRLDHAVLPHEVVEHQDQHHARPVENGRSPGLSVTDVLRRGGWERVAIYLEDRALRRAVADVWSEPVARITPNRPRL